MYQLQCIGQLKITFFFLVEGYALILISLENMIFTSKKLKRKRRKAIGLRTVTKNQETQP